MEPSSPSAVMHPERWQRIDELFHAAVDLAARERSVFLDRECAGDVSLRAEIEKLVDGSDRAGSFIESPLLLDETTMELADSDRAPAAGLRLGAYEVIREIGRGGMGTVYLGARADKQFSKRVAIKVVTAGFDNETIIRRFRIERQILAGLDHPNIARLLDGGTTESGAPYFVMEYIEGENIREYCDFRKHLLLFNRRSIFFGFDQWNQRDDLQSLGERAARADGSIRHPHNGSISTTKQPARIAQAMVVSGLHR